jgi:hypothetical protein
VYADQAARPAWRNGYDRRMIRRLLSLAFLASVIVLALTAATSAKSPKPAVRAASARARKPAIKAIEVGYFGSGLVAHQIDVFVYSNLGPRAGTHVKVCVNRVCKRASGHSSATLAWYRASFASQPLRMGAPVTFTATASNAAGHTRTTVTKGLLCMHNDGSTPQT